MLKPTFRSFIVPLGAICRQHVVDCSRKNPAEVCVISYDSETSAR
jgi:hypothetical protein